MSNIKKKKKTEKQTDISVCGFDNVKIKGNMYFVQKDAQEIRSCYIYRKLQMFSSSRKQIRPEARSMKDFIRLLQKGACKVCFVFIQHTDIKLLEQKDFPKSFLLKTPYVTFPHCTKKPPIFFLYRSFSKTDSFLQLHTQNFPMRK